MRNSVAVPSSAARQGIFVQLDADGEDLQTCRLSVGNPEAASAQQHTRLDAALNKTASSQAGHAAGC